LISEVFPPPATPALHKLLMSACARLTDAVALMNAMCSKGFADVGALKSATVPMLVQYVPGI